MIKLFFILAVYILTIIQMPAATYALSAKQKKVYDSGSYYYDVDISECNGGTSVNAPGQGSPTDASNLNIQGLDQRWQDLIIKYANKFGTDPILMAAILFWEHRGFPAYQDPATPEADDSDSNGRGPWQITSNAWPTSAGNYSTDVYRPDNSTKAAAYEIKGNGGYAGLPLGSIEQEFGHNKQPKTVATALKNYNAGNGTYRLPGIAKWHQAGRRWGYNNGSAFKDWASIMSSKPDIIDDYVVAGTYLYYQMASGQKITYKDPSSYIKEALDRQDEIKDFKYGGGGGGCGNNGAVGGSAVQTALNFAWPQYHDPRSVTVDGSQWCKQKPAYTASITKPGIYTGAWCGYGGRGPENTSLLGVDCGAFVTRVMIESGADPGYNRGGTYSGGAGNTSTQEAYLREQAGKKYVRLTNVNSADDLEPGDIAIYNSGPDGHTYIFVGHQPGFGGNSASASEGTRSPMASSDSIGDGNPYEYYRLKDSAGGPTP